jgi:catechol 2,3-dioxygenase-like lactoylglutathione lyase family enzyme
MSGGRRLDHWRTTRVSDGSSLSAPTPNEQERSMDPPDWRFTHVHVYASDPRATINWLTDLGGEVVAESQYSDWPTMFNVSLGGQIIQVRGERGNEQFAPTRGERSFGIDHIGLVVTDVDTTLAALQARGIAAETEFANGYEVPEGVAFLRGPDDLWVEIAPAVWYPESDFPPPGGLRAAIDESA